MTAPELFPDVPRVDPAPEPEPLSYDRRLTIRRNQMLADGIHPTSRRPLLPIGHPNHGTNCRSCKHCVGYRAARTYWKCLQVPGGATGGPVTDTRLSWPACELWEPDEDTA